MIQTINVSLSYDNGVQALRHVSIRIGKGEFVFIVGPTGSGKSSFLKLLNREEVPTSGQVLVAGKDVVRMRPRHVPGLRRSVGVVFQDFRLLPQRTVWENVAFALRVIGAPGREVRRRTGAALEVVNLAAKADAYPHEISGGEQQRASIARAIVNNPSILLADEPTGNLDSGTAADILQLIASLREHSRMTIILATHDPQVAAQCERLIRLRDGAVVDDIELADGYPVDDVIRRAGQLG